MLRSSKSLSTIDAIPGYDTILDRAPDDVYAHNNKGLALQKLALLLKLLNESQASTLLREAVVCWERSLTLTPEDTQI